MPNIVSVGKAGSISAQKKPHKASNNLKSGHGASVKVGAKSSFGPSRNQHLPAGVRVDPKSGKYITYKPLKTKAVEYRKVAPVRRVVTGEPGNHLKAKLSSNLKITKPAGSETKVGEKRSHAEVSGSQIVSTKATPPEVTGAPKTKKTKIDSAGHDADYTKKTMDDRKHEDNHTAIRFADWCFRADPACFLISREVKWEVCNNLAVPGVMLTTEEYITNLMSFRRFQEVARRACRIFKGEEPVNDAVIITFVFVDCVNRDGPTSKAWVTAQLIALLAVEVDFKWRKTGIYRGYRRLLRYLQGCRNDEFAFDPDLGAVLLRKARAGEGAETLNPLNPTPEPTRGTSMELEPLEHAPEDTDQTQHLKQSSNVKYLPTRLRMDNTVDGSVASGPNRDNVLE